MATYAEDIDDMVTLVINNHYKYQGKAADLASKFPDNFVASKIFSMMKEGGDGHTVTFDCKIKNVGNFRDDVGLFDVDQTARDDMFVEGQVQYTGLNISTYFDIHEKRFMSPKAAVKEDYIKKLIDAAFQRFMLKLSTRFWTYPASSGAKGILGFPYWVAQDDATTATAFGFNGEDVYGDNIVGNINQSTYPSWRNGTGVFSTFASEDGLDLLSQAMDECDFRTNDATIGNPDDRSSLPDRVLFTTYNNHQDYERYIRNQNDNVGDDAGRYRGPGKMFRKTPLVYLWEFTKSETEDNHSNPAVVTDNPVYGINFETFDFLSMLGTGLKRTGPRQAPNQRFVRRVDWDQFAQLVCTDRRKNFCLHQAS